MAVDPKILERMKASRQPVDPEDDGSEGAMFAAATQAYIDGMTPLTGAPLAQRGQSLGLPDLTGTPKQIKWALTIREDALELEWPPETATVLKSIVDSTWWIANKAIVHTMKFKAPSPHQIVGGPPAPPKGQTQSGPPPAQYAPPAPAATLDRRLEDIFGFAASVSRHPRAAEAAVLAAMAKLYKGPTAEAIRRRGREVAADAEFEFKRDLDAVNKMLA